MPTAAPLQILLFCHPDDREVPPYQTAIVRGFQGGIEAGNYLATGDDLGIQLEVFSTAPPLGPAQTLDNFCHAVIVFFVDHALLNHGGAALWDWLAECWTIT